MAELKKDTSTDPTKLGADMHLDTMGFKRWKPKHANLSFVTSSYVSDIGLVRSILVTYKNISNK